MSLVRVRSILPAAACAILAAATAHAQPNQPAQPARGNTPRLPVASRQAEMRHVAPPPAARLELGSGPGEQRTAVYLQAGAPTEQYNHGDPTAEEQYLLELINRARSNPKAEGEMLAGVTDPAILSAYQYFNVDKNKLKTDFAAYPVRPPLAFNRKLIASARLHSQDMSTNNFQGHVGSNGSTFDQRIVAQGYTNWTGLGENVSAYSRNLLYSHVGFNVDWGVPDLGHRNNIMNFSGSLYTEAGIGIVHDERPAPHVGPIIVTHNFGNAASPFILGVVYKDLNGNSFYDVGEGLAGVTVMPSVGQYYAITSTSGGYAIPVTAKGSITLTVSGGALGSTLTKNVTVDNENVKADFVQGSGPGVPGAVSLVEPLAGATVSKTPVRLSWRRIASVAGYHVQVSADSTFANLLSNDSLATDSSWTFAAAMDGMQYFWRVRARNATGWGSYSSHRSFTTVLPPAQVRLVDPTSSATIATENVMFRWRRGAASETRYWFEIATEPTFASAMRDSTVADTFAVANGLAPGTIYYWRVKAWNSVGWGPFSTIWNATTATSGVEATAEAGSMMLSVAPNPTSTETAVTFELAGPADVVVSLTDQLGREVGVLADGRHAAGRHTVRWDAAGVPGGVYFCSVRAGASVRTLRVVVAR